MGPGRPVLVAPGATRLRDALGTSRARGSRAEATIYKTAAEARRSLGPRLVPVAAGNQLYELAEQVSCDWNRFEELVAIAHRCDQPGQRREALIEALALVDGVPAHASNRFIWLDDEGLSTRIEMAVLEVAQHLARAARLEGLSELAAWAIAKGRLLAPDSPELGEIERSLLTLLRRTERAPQD